MSSLMLFPSIDGVRCTCVGARGSCGERVEQTHRQTCAHTHNIHTRMMSAVAHSCCRLGFQGGLRRGVCVRWAHVCVCSSVRLQSLYFSTVNTANLASSMQHTHNFASVHHGGMFEMCRLSTLIHRV